MRFDKKQVDRTTNAERQWAMLCLVVWRPAVRDTTIDGLEIHENNLGMVDGKIVVSNPDMMETLEEIHYMLDEDSEIVTIYVGDGSEEL